MAPRRPNPYIEPSSCCSSCIWSGPRRHLLEMLPYALPPHSVPAHTPNGIPRTESRGTSSRSTCTAGSRARLPGVSFRVVRDQEPRAARELAEAHVPRPVLHHPCLRCIHCLRRLRPEPRPPTSRTRRSSCSGDCGCTPCPRAQRPPPLISERGSAAVTVTRLSRRAPSAVPPPAQPTTWAQRPVGRARFCGGDCHAPVSSRTQCGPAVPSADYNLGATSGGASAALRRRLPRARLVAYPVRSRHAQRTLHPP